jgi:hypothetical protein
MILDRAVLRFAERGEGEVEWVAPFHRLRAGVHDVSLVIDAAQCSVTVIRFYRAR